MVKRSLGRMEAERVCAKFPDAPNVQLARKLRKEHPLLFASVEVARSAIRTIRGANGTRNPPTQTRPKGFAGQLPPIPPNVHDDYQDLVIDAKRVGILCDLHFPHAVWRVIKAACVEFKRRNIDCLILNGDICDFHELSIYEHDPRDRQLAFEIKKAAEAMAWFRQAFPKARIIYKWGNHDERWNKYLWRQAPVLLDLPNATLESVLMLQHYGVEQVVDKQLIDIGGKFLVAHGHEISKGAAHHIAKQVAGKLQRPGCVGHSHRTDRHAITPHMRRHEYVYAIGAACKLKPPFSIVNGWNWGFGLAENHRNEVEFDNYIVRDDYKVIR